MSQNQSGELRLDQYLKHFDYTVTHSRQVPGAPDAALFELVRHLDFSSSWIIRTLFFLRGLGTKNLNLDAMVSGSEFFLLEELPSREVVIGGMAGPQLKPVRIRSAPQFLEFADHNGIKIAWNFLLTPGEANTTIVSTETRVACLGPKMKRRFSIYWFFVRPFSGLVRLEMLRILNKQARAMRAATQAL
ncbi:MAG: hypothetical protein NXI24_22540 [bacterium]|nr:hypothetical protein [bacterium]